MTAIIDIITQAFYEAKARHPDLHQTWTLLSLSIGARLPHSLLDSSLQKAGELDMLLRSIEDQYTAEGPNTSAFHYQMFISELWIGQIYEIFRVLVSDLKDETLRPILTDLELIRIPLEKYQLRMDAKLKGPVHFVSSPPRNDKGDHYCYEPGAQGRSHIMPTSVSERGSCMWMVLDIIELDSFWIERRELSDRIIEALAKNEATQREL